MTDQSAECAGPADLPVIPLALVRPVTGALVSEEQLVYASHLDTGMKFGLLALVVTFLVYLTGALAPLVPVGDLPRYWAMPVKDYLAATGAPTGWGWVNLLSRGDFLNFVGIAFLSGVTIFCYLAVIPIFLRKGDRAYVALAVVEVLVLVLAASGLLTAGGH
jgi:hypothetical protein